MSNTLEQQLKALEKTGGLRKRQPMQVQGTEVRRLGADESLLNFSSNDYLGLAGDKGIQADFFANYDFPQNCLSASSSRALTGTSLLHQQLEQVIAGSYQKDSALLFNSGYHANTGILPALAQQGDLILADKLVHASIIDGLQLSKAEFKRFAHNDLAHLQRLLEKYRQQYDRVWLVTESLFSMDGDVAPLTGLVQLKQQYGCYLYVDEAHAIGCYGKQGLGLAEELELVDEIDVLVGVFGKALASSGAFVAANQLWVNALVNYSRSWLFSTALPPLTIAWNLYIWQRLAQFGKQRQQLHALSEQLRNGFAGLGFNVLGESYIVPLVCGDNSSVLDLSAYLEKQGFLAMPIRSPTVKAGSERVRFSLTANILTSDIEKLLTVIKSHAS